MFPAGHAKLRSVLLREPPPLAALARRPSYPWLVIGTVCIGAFMGQADASIAQMVLPVLERDFGEPLRIISWVAIAYMLVLAALLPVIGRLADLYGRKLLYTAGFLLFIAGSAVCGAASNIGSLIAFRVVQAAGAALLQANSVAIVISAAKPEHRGRAIGLQATAQAVGLGVGPAIGGLLIYALNWRWVFWLNVPFGLLGVVIGWMVLPQTKHLITDEHIDWWGTVILAPAITALMLMINQGENWGVTSAAFVSCAVAAFLLVPMFIWRERRQRSPLVDLALFRRHAFWAGNLAGLLSYAMLFGMFFLMPFIFARAYHESALIAGLQLSVIPAALGLVAPVSGALYDRAGPRLLTGSGMALSFGAFAILGLTMTDRPVGRLLTVVALALFGIGQGLFTSPNNSSIMAAPALNQVGQAGGILNVTRSFGTSVGVVCASALLEWRLGVLTGHVGYTLHAPPEALLVAGREVVMTFAAFALAAGVLSSLRPHHASS